MKIHKTKRKNGHVKRLILTFALVAGAFTPSEVRAIKPARAKSNCLAMYAQRLLKRRRAGVRGKHSAEPVYTIAWRGIQSLAKPNMLRINRRVL